MAETLVEKNEAKARLEQYLATHKVKIARTVEELYVHSIADDNGEEVDDFMKLREEWRKEDEALSKNFFEDLLAERTNLSDGESIKSVIEERKESIR